MSQFGEDKAIAAILGEIGSGTKVLADLGARLQFSNTVGLILKQGWTGTLVDKSNQHCNELCDLIGDRAQIVCTSVDIENVNALVPANAWLLSLDIDSDDFWVWANLIHRPAIVIVETNAANGMHVACYKANGKSEYGMSKSAAIWLGEAKGYFFVGMTGVNAFFVRKDLPCKFRLPSHRTYPDACYTARNVLCA